MKNHNKSMHKLSFLFIVGFFALVPFFVNAATSTTQSDSLDAIDPMTSAVFGTSIGLDWGAYSGADLYAVSWVSISDDPDNYVAALTGQTSYIISNLLPETKYYVAVFAMDSDMNEVAEAATMKTASAPLGTTRFTRPSVPKKTIRRRKATVKWAAPTAASYVSHYHIQLKTKNKKQIKSFKNVSPTDVKKIIPKKYLRPGRTYNVRVRVHFVNGGMTKFSRYQKFTTKQ